MENVIDQLPFSEKHAVRTILKNGAKYTDNYLRVAGIRGLLTGMLSSLLNTHTFLKITRQDIKFPIYLRTSSSDVPTYDQVFLKGEYEFNVKYSPKVIIDAGANIGLASIYFANKFPEVKILAIEPEASNFEMLKKNTAQYENIIPIHGALWNENNQIDLMDPGLGEWGFMTQEVNLKEENLGERRHRVKGLTIDRIMEEHGIEFADILKIDIEGAEREVFNDPSGWISKVGALIIELHERMKSGCNRSFYNATNDFDEEWHQGENEYLTRKDGCLAKRVI